MLTSLCSHSISQVLEDAAAGKLSGDEYPFVRAPSSPGGSNAASAEGTPTGAGASARSVRTTGAWARKGIAGSPEKVRLVESQGNFILGHPYHQPAAYER